MDFKKSAFNRLGSKGFTLIEIIAVLIILGIIAAVVISRGAVSEEIKAQADVDTLKGRLRFAQTLAMNDLPGGKCGIQVGSSSYTLVKIEPTGETTSMPLPGESSATYRFTSAATASVTGSNPILFDDWGDPGSTATTISLGGKTVTVTANTGFIP